MAIYIVMEPPQRQGAEAAERALLVRDGFAFFAFLVPPLWLAVHRLWIEAAFALVVGLALGALGTVAGFGLAGSLLPLLVAIYVGLEGNALRVAALRRRGWREWGVVEGDGLDDAETRYLTEIASIPEQSEPTPDPSAPPTRRAIAPAQQAGTTLGLIGYPGVR